MSKKVEEASMALQNALKEHAKWLSRPKAKPAKLEAAAWKVRAAARAYTKLVLTRAGAGTTNPLIGIPSPQLDDDAVSSLAAERDHLKRERENRKNKRDSDAPTG